MARADATRNSEVRNGLIRAFWNLLEEQPLEDITVGALTQRAQCNRGSFYYHYDGLPDLLDDALQRELGQIRQVINLMFELAACEQEDAVGTALDGCPHQFGHVCLLMRQGGHAAVERRLRQEVLHVWQAALGCDAAQIEPAALFIIEFHLGGMLAVLPHLDEGADARAGVALQAYLEGYARLLMGSMSAIQGMDQAEFVQRFNRALRSAHA